jgi:hypothetical protein
MWQSIIAVAGTLLGGIVTAALQQRAARTQRTEDRSTGHRDATLTAVTELATAPADHRRAMWVREDLRLRGEGWESARAESHTTRAAITAPMVRVQVLAPELADAAAVAATATYALRGAVDDDALQAARAAAVRAADTLVAAAAQDLA